MKLTYTNVLYISAALFGMLLSPSAAQAQSVAAFPVESVDPVVRNDFVIGPGKVELEMSPGDAVETEITVTNRMGESKTFRIEIEDMTGSQDPNTPVVLLGDDRGPYTLRDYVSVPVYEFTLEHGTRARIPVTVSLPVDAEPGGRYGSVLVSTVSRDADDGALSGAAPRSAIVGRVGALFFVRTPGITSQSGALVDFSTIPEQTVFNEGPINFGLVYENTGSVHTNPYGYISITNLSGEEVGFVELDPWFALPNSLRQRDVTWEREQLFGKYTATAVINRGYDDQVDTQSVTFWVVNWQLIIAVFGGMMLLLLVVRYIGGRFEIRRR